MTREMDEVAVLIQVWQNDFILGKLNSEIYQNSMQTNILTSHETNVDYNLARCQVFSIWPWTKIASFMKQPTVVESVLANSTRRELGKWKKDWKCLGVNGVKPGGGGAKPDCPLYKFSLLLKIFLWRRNFCYEVNFHLWRGCGLCGELPHINTFSYIRDIYNEFRIPPPPNATVLAEYVINLFLPPPYAKNKMLSK